MSKRTPIILVDADVVIHFMKGGKILELSSVFPCELKMLDLVYDELLSFRGKEFPIIVNLQQYKVIKILPFPTDNFEMEKEYQRIKTKEYKGKGESACMAYVRFNKENIIGSSNLKDIRRYCTMHKLKYLTTLDFLYYGLHFGKFSIDECNQFIADVKSKNSKLPVNKMEEYVPAEETIAIFEEMKQIKSATS